MAALGLATLVVGASVRDETARHLFVDGGGAVIVCSALIGIYATYRFYTQDRREREAGYTTTKRGWFYRKYWRLDPKTGEVIRGPS